MKELNHIPPQRDNKPQQMNDLQNKNITKWQQITTIMTIRKNKTMKSQQITTIHRESPTPTSRHCGTGSPKRGMKNEKHGKGNKSQQL